MQTVLMPRLNPAASEFHPRLGTTLNPVAAVFYPAFRHCHGIHVDGDEARVSKYQILRTGDSDRRGMGRLHPPRGTNKQGKYRDRRAVEKSEWKKSSVEVRQSINQSINQSDLCKVTHDALR